MPESRRTISKCGLNQVEIEHLRALLAADDSSISTNIQRVLEREPGAPEVMVTVESISHIEI